MSEVPVRFGSPGDARIGIIHLPPRPDARGVLIIAGGWQYRVGSHRQFVVLSRALAAAGIPSMRFDPCGIGDSDGIVGEPEPAEHLGRDIGAALDVFVRHIPRQTECVLCGLCDGASAALIYAPTDPRVGGLILLNPWVSSKRIAARAILRRYYPQHLFDYDLWRRIVTGRFKLQVFIGSLLANIRTAALGREDPTAAPEEAVAAAGRRIDRGMAESLDRFTGRILLVLSGQDATAARYADIVDHSPRWRALLRGGDATRIAASGADHTFSGRASLDALARDIIDWMRS